MISPFSPTEFMHKIACRSATEKTRCNAKFSQKSRYATADAEGARRSFTCLYRLG